MSASFTQRPSDTRTRLSALLWLRRKPRYVSAFVRRDFRPVPVIKPNCPSFAKRWWKLSRCDHFCLHSRHLERGMFSGSQTIPSPDAALGDRVFAPRKPPPFSHSRPHSQPFRLSNQIPRAVLGLGITHAPGVAGRAPRPAPCARHCHKRLRLLRAPVFSAGRGKLRPKLSHLFDDEHFDGLAAGHQFEAELV